MSSNSPVPGNGRNSWKIVCSCFKQKVEIRWSFFLMFHRLDISLHPKSLETGIRFLEISSAIKPEPGYPFEFGSSFARWRLSHHQGVFPGRRDSSYSIGLPSLGWSPSPTIHQTSGKIQTVIDLETDHYSNKHSPSSKCGGSLYVLVSSNSKQCMFCVPRKN